MIKNNIMKFYGKLKHVQFVEQNDIKNYNYNYWFSVLLSTIIHLIITTDLRASTYAYEGNLRTYIIP